METRDLERLLLEVKQETVSVEDALERLARLPLRDLGHSVVDTHRELRCGFPEAIFAAEKSPDELVEIAQTLVETHGRMLATRVQPDGAAALLEALPDATLHERSRAVTVDRRADPEPAVGRVLVVSAGTSDGPVAEEAAVTARMCGAAVETLADVGVAGIHRLLASSDRLRAARVLVVVAGMEGALPGVVGGLVDRPVIAVPTSVGYGASFGGIAALLAMLNSCAAGVTVVNIDNGFGAGYAAALMNRLSLPTDDS